MAELTTLARPYAKAAFQHALAANQLQSRYDALEVAAAVAAQGACPVASRPSAKPLPPATPERDLDTCFPCIATA